MKKRMFLTLLLCLALLLSLIGCHSSADNGVPNVGGGALADDYGTSGGGEKGESAVSADRKIITTVNERLETEAYDTLIESLRAEVSGVGGYFVSSNYSGNGVETRRERYAFFEIRIPAEKLSSFTGKLGTLGTVLSYKETANDVTLAYVDIESRIAVWEAEEAALLAILAQAESTADILTIRSTLSDTQAELASLRAQKETYDTLVAYSTVHLTVNEVAHARSEDSSFFSEVGDSFKESLADVGGFFRGAFVFLLGSSPILLLIAAIGVGVFFLARAVLRRVLRKGQTLPRSASRTEENTPQDEETDEK